MNFKLFGTLAALSLASIVVAYELAKQIESNKCASKIEDAVSSAINEIQLEIERSNTNQEKSVIKTIKQNEIIKTTISSYDLVQRTRLLKQIEDFENSEQFKESL